MEIPISYYPILHLPSVKPNGLALLKSSGQKTQKWGLIGSGGIFYSYRFKEKELKSRFTYSFNNDLPEICVSNRDQFIVSSKNELYVLNKKGQSQKFKNLPFEESISCLCFNQSTGRIIAAAGSLISEIKADSGNLPKHLPSPAVSIIFRESICYVGCNDGTILTFIGGGLQTVAKLPSPLTCLAPLQRTSMQSYIVAATTDCMLRFYNAQDKLVSTITLSSPATAMASHDFDNDGFAEVIVALEDSTINLINLALIDTPKVLSSLQLGFNVTNIGIGPFYYPDVVSALITSQTGQTGIVFIEPRSDRSVFSSKAPKVTNKEIDDLRKTVGELEVKAKQANLKQSAVIPAQATVDIRGDPITQKFIFLVESERPISRICLSSTIKLDYYSRPDCQILLTLCPPKKDAFACIIKPLDTTATRIAFDFSYQVGNGGELVTYVSFAKNNAVLNRNFTLKPFGLLKRIDDDGTMKKVADDSIAILEVTSFNSSTLRSLLDNCLPTMLEDDEPQTFSYGVIGAQVTVVVRGDKFVAKSIFFPIIVQLRNFILESMNKAKQRVVFDTKLGDNCIVAFFKKIKDRMFKVMEIGSKYHKLKALQEVRNSSQTANFGDEETTRILQDAPTIEKDFMDCKDEYNGYIDEVQTFYIEMWKRNNIDSSLRIPDLLAALKEVKDDDTLEVLIEFMQSQPK